MSGWLSDPSAAALDFMAMLKRSFGKVFTRKEIYNFARTEVCGVLHRARYLVSSGTEGQWLAERLEPWLGLARPISHNLDTRVYYWPEIEL